MKKYFKLLTPVLYDFILLAISAAVASYIVVFSICLMGTLYNSVQINWKFLLQIGLVGFVAGPFFASPYLLIFMLPWISILRIKRIKSFLFWIFIPGLLAAGYGYLIAELPGPTREIGSPSQCSALFGSTGFLTAAFLWVRNFILFKKDINYASN